jgi:hypothetical protein
MPFEAGSTPRRTGPPGSPASAAGGTCSPSRTSRTWWRSIRAAERRQARSSAPAAPRTSASCSDRPPPTRSPRRYADGTSIQSSPARPETPRGPARGGSYRARLVDGPGAIDEVDPRAIGRSDRHGRAVGKALGAPPARSPERRHRRYPARVGVYPRVAGSGEPAARSQPRPGSHVALDCPRRSRPLPRFARRSGRGRRVEAERRASSGHDRRFDSRPAASELVDPGPTVLATSGRDRVPRRSPRARRAASPSAKHARPASTLHGSIAVSAARARPTADELVFHAEASPRRRSRSTRSI